MAYYVSNWQDIKIRAHIIADEGTDVATLPTHFCPGSIATVIGDKVYQLSASYEWEEAPSQGGGASSWAELTDKPFDTIGDGLYVENGVLKAISTIPTSWADIQKAVRRGLGARLFPVGYEFTTYDSDKNLYIIWVVRAHDHHLAANGILVHTMTIEIKYVYSGTNGSLIGFTFDAPEAMYYATEGLAAGTYNFTWGYATGSMVKGTYQFTLTQAVPAGGQIVLGTNYASTAITSCKVSTYASAGDTSAIESDITVTEDDGGTSLGTMSAAASTEANLNCCQRVMWGSNNYAQSAVRQWLNSSAAAGAVWTPTNKFDRAPLWNSNNSGFMYGLPSDFLAVVQPAVVPCRTNSAFEVESLDGTIFTTNQVYSLEDKFFLLSRPEIFGDWDSESYKDGTQLEYYEGLTATERIKRDAAGSERAYWLRSPTPGGAYSERFVRTAGNLDGGSVYGDNGVAPACIIA